MALVLQPNYTCSSSIYYLQVYNWLQDFIPIQICIDNFPSSFTRKANGTTDEIMPIEATEMQSELPTCRDTCI